MALTISEVRRSVFGNRRIQVLDLTFDTSYATGGLALTPAALGMQEFDMVLAGTAAGYMFEFDYVNNKLTAVHPRAAITGTLAATAGTLAGSIPAGATGVTSDAAQPVVGMTGAPALTGVAGVTAGAGAEVPATTNLSTVKVRVIVIGI